MNILRSIVFMLLINLPLLAGIDALDSQRQKSVILEISKPPKVGDQIQVNHIQGGGLFLENVIYSDGYIVGTIDQAGNEHIYYLNPGYEEGGPNDLNQD